MCAAGHAGCMHSECHHCMVGMPNGCICVQDRHSSQQSSAPPVRRRTEDELPEGIRALKNRFSSASSDSSSPSPQVLDEVFVFASSVHNLCNSTLLHNAHLQNATSTMYVTSTVGTNCHQITSVKTCSVTDLALMCCVIRL